MKLILAFIFFFGLADGKSEFTIVSVSGKVSVKGSDEILKTGDKITEDARLVFSSKSINIAIMREGVGHFYLRPSEKTKRSGKQWSDKVENMMRKPKNSEASPHRAYQERPICNTCTKDDFLELVLHFAKNLESDNPNEFQVIDRGAYAIDSEVFPQDDKNFFALQYSHGIETIYRPLAHQEDSLIINSDIYQNEKGEAIAPIDVSKMKIYYVDEYEEREGEAFFFDPSQELYITDFMPRIISHDDIKREIQVIISNLPKMKPVEVYENHILPHLIEFYPGMSDEKIKALLSDEFKNELN